MAKFELFQNGILAVEGGYQANANDSGNYNAAGKLVGTNKGISAKTLEKWLGRSVTVQDMQNLDTTTALKIYKAYYWDQYRMHEVTSQQVANIVADGTVNHGPGSRSKSGGISLMQEALNDLGEGLTEDGIVGFKTIAALNRQIGISESRIYNRYRQKRIDYYHEIAQGNQAGFLEGWLHRMDHFPVMAEAEVIEEDTTGDPLNVVKDTWYLFSGILSVNKSNTARKEWIWIAGGGVIIAALVIITIRSWQNQ